MTLCWETHANGTHYSVRSAGATIRLYSNGVFHSQWNPQRPFAGGIWDCLSLPCLYRPTDKARRVLLLGVGGGAVIRQLELLLPIDEFTAIEIDPVHITVAKQWFEVDENRVELIRADAINWLQRYRGPAFDYVVDDLFGHDEGEPVRAQAITVDWVSRLRQVTTENGLLIMNCVSAAELKASLPAIATAGFPHGFRWTIPTYDNAIAVLAQETLIARDWSRNLANLALPAELHRRAQATIRRPLRYDAETKGQKSRKRRR